MQSNHRSRFTAVRLPLLFLSAAISTSACQDAGTSDNPFSDDSYPVKGQSVAVSPEVAEIVNVGERLQLTATVRDAVGKQLSNPRVNWATMNPSVATVDFDGNVTGVAEGVVEIKGTYGNASGTSVIAVAKKLNDKGNGNVGNGKNTSVTIYPDADTIPTVGGSIKLLAVGRNDKGNLVSGNNMNWSTTTDGVVRVDDQGNVTGLVTGTAEVVASNGSSSDTSTVWVAPPNVAVAIRISPKTDTIPSVGGSVVLSATLLNGAGGSLGSSGIEWKSLEPSIATVGDAGKVVGGANGVARIVASYGSLADTARVWIGAAPDPVGLFVTPKLDSLTVGSTRQMAATLLDANGKSVTGLAVTWSSLEPTTAGVDANGLVKANLRGQARIVAKYKTLADTARVVILDAPVPTAPFRVVVTPHSDTIPSLGSVVVLSAHVYDANNREFPTVLPTWTSLDAATASVSPSGTASSTVSVTGKATGVARIKATYGTASDSSLVLVQNGTTGGNGTGVANIQPASATLPVIGDSVQMKLMDAQGNNLNGVEWMSLDESVVFIGDRGTAMARGVGTTRVIGRVGNAADTATIHVGAPQAAKPTIVVNPAVDTIPSVGGTRQLGATVKDTLGHTISSASIGWTSIDPLVASVNGSGVVTGQAKGWARIRATYGSVADTALVVVAPGSIGPVPQGGASITPMNLRPALGPMIPRAYSGAPIGAYDSKYTQYEKARFQDFLGVLNDPSGAYLSANHYGGLRSRLMWAIRNGEPYGVGVTDESKFAYARGRRIVRRYLEWSKSYKYLVPAHNNTGLADVEAYYMLEGDPDALAHIHVTASGATADPFGYLKMQNQSADARQIAVALQAMMMAHRLGLPYGKSPANTSQWFDGAPGSWKASGQREIGWIQQYVVKADGSIPSPAHGGQEAYLFNAMLATRLLEWCAFIGWDATAYNLAVRIMDHVVASQRPGWSTLPYTSNSSGPAPDLAAFYVWPALALWQETGDSKYYDLAMSSLSATSQAYLLQVKQWNQVYSTGAQGAEALMAGVRWH